RSQSELIEKIEALNDEITELNKGILALYKELDDKNRELERTYKELQKHEELKKLNEELKNTLEDKNKIEQKKNELISVVSHELRAPLTSIAGTLNIILSKLRDNVSNEVLELVNLSFNSAKRMQNLINNILNLEKIETDNFEMMITENNIDEIIQTVISDLSTQIKEKNMQIEYQQTKYSAFCDWNATYRVFMNLLSNAIKFSSNNGKIIINVIEYDCENLKKTDENARCINCSKCARISIRDYGRGIPEHFKDKIFGKFKQAQVEDATVKGGSGLGLAICKLLVQKQNGKIWFESKEGEGAEFFFTLPFFNPNIKKESNEINK
ncbi:MAG TPA: ATP-binding protein, partial [bacterium]|nr:ATP-binding protein [bacterium]